MSSKSARSATPPTFRHKLLFVAVQVAFRFPHGKVLEVIEHPSRWDFRVLLRE